MEEPMYNMFLNGMPVQVFLVFYVWALLGSLMFFLYSLYQALRNDSRTSRKFEWRYFGQGAIRVFLSIVGLALGILFWDDWISKVLFESDSVIELTGKSAFLLGTLVDRLLEALLGSGKDAGNYIKKKLS
jgi:hypothetical protein